MKDKNGKAAIIFTNTPMGLAMKLIIADGGGKPVDENAELDESTLNKAQRVALHAYRRLIEIIDEFPLSDEEGERGEKIDSSCTCPGCKTEDKGDPERMKNACADDRAARKEAAMKDLVEHFGGDATQKATSMTDDPVWQRRLQEAFVTLAGVNKLIQRFIDDQRKGGKNGTGN